MLNSKVRFICLTLIFPLFLLPAIFNADFAKAANCVNKACIDVYAENGQLVIEARKGASATAHSKSAAKPPRKAVPSPVRKAVLRPRVKQSAAPRSVAKPQVKPAAPAPRKYVAPKRAPRNAVKRATAAQSFNDKLIKLIPTGNIAHQPTSNVLVNVPTIFWCDLPALFSSKVAIIGESVDVAMRPSFVWSFGDGAFSATTDPGRPYPQQQITHTYTKAGTYIVTLVATWGGTWSHNAIARSITGEIRKVSVAVVQVGTAPTRITQ